MPPTPTPTTAAIALLPTSRAVLSIESDSSDDIDRLSRATDRLGARNMRQLAAAAPRRRKEFKLCLTRAERTRLTIA